MDNPDYVTSLGTLGNMELEVYECTTMFENEDGQPETKYAYVYQHTTEAWIRITDMTGIGATFADAIPTFIDNIAIS